MQTRLAPPPPAIARHSAVALGGVIGALLRYGHGALVGTADPGAFPWGTFTINVAGSLALATLLAALQESARAHPLWRPFYGVGVCGAYTTHSAYEYEALALVRLGSSGIALAYLVATLIAGIAAALVGARLVRRFRGGRWRLPVTLSLLLAPAAAFAVAGVVAVLIEGSPRRPAESLVLGCVAVAVGGSAGALARDGMGGWVGCRAGPFFPWGTVTVNLTGCALIGMFEGIAGAAPPLLRLLLVTGVLGGYTTFSTFACETLALVGDGGRRRAGALVLVSVGGGFAAVAFGHALGSWIRGGS